MNELNIVPENQITQILARALTLLDNVIIFGKTATELAQAKGLIQIAINSYVPKEDLKKEDQELTGDCCSGVCMNSVAN